MIKAKLNCLTKQGLNQTRMFIKSDLLISSVRTK